MNRLRGRLKKGDSMRLERINENKIRFILDREDLEERDLQVSELAYGSEKAKALFDDLMEMAREELGFSDGPQPLMVEAIPMANSGLMVNISRVDNPDELDPRFSRFTNGIEYDHEIPDSPGPADDEDDEDGPGFGPEGPDEEMEYEGEPPEGSADGPDFDADDKQGPDGVQIQQGPEIRAEVRIPKSSEINPQDIMSMIDNIVSGLAGKVGAQVIKGAGNSGTSGPTPKAQEKPKPGEPDPFVLYEFRDLQSIIQAAKLVGDHYDSENVLYKNPVNQRYYLYLGRERNSLDEFAQLCAVMNEFGSRCRISYASKEYFEEHAVKLMEDALIQLEEL